MHNNMIDILKKKYIKKLSNPKDILLKVIQAGDKIFIGSGAAEPMTLVETLLDIEKYFTDTEVVSIEPSLSQSMFGPDGARTREPSSPPNKHIGLPSDGLTRGYFPS